jgi:phenylacetyl-CoA:acceptor oxidoreductase subunit 2
MSGSKAWLPANVEARTVGNFTFGATGAGLAAGAAVSELLTGHGQWGAYLLAMLLVGGLLSLLWRETGNPLRFVKVAFRPETSWTTREALIAPVLLVVMPVAAIFGGGLLSLIVVGLAAGLLYAQSQILQTTEGVPAWRVKPIMGLILATGFAEGAGALTLVNTVFDSAAVPQAIRLAIVLVVVRWPLWTFYRDAVSAAPMADAVADATKAALRRFNTLFQALGLLAPIILLTAAVLTPAFGGLLAALGGLVAIAGGWALKYTLITRPAFTQGAAVPLLPAQGTAPAEEQTEA